MNEGETELLAAVARIVGVFDELGVDYLVGGSATVSEVKELASLGKCAVLTISR